MQRRSLSSRPLLALPSTATSTVATQLHNFCLILQQHNWTYYAHFSHIFVRNLPGVAEAECVAFADDLTEPAADTSLEIVAQKLTSSFGKTKEFCNAHDLKVNANKTQLVIFKAANRKIADDFEIILDSQVIKPSNSARLLGFTIDRHLTGAEHIDNI